jgi:hypothetical protein
LVFVFTFPFDIAVLGFKVDIRIVDAVEIKGLKSASFLRDIKKNHMENLRAWLRELGFGRQHCFLVAELEGQALGYLEGFWVNTTGKLEDFFVRTEEGMAEAGQGLMEIFEVLCLARHCKWILAPGWMDEVLITARGFRSSGSIYVKSLS